MNIFKRHNARSGLTAIGLQPEGLCVAHVRRGNGHPRVSGFEFRAWDGGAVHDRKTIARLATEFGLKHGACTTVLEPADYKLLLIDAPEVQAQEMRAAVRWRIKDMIDFNINDAVVDLIDLPGTPAGSQRSVYATVAQKQVIQQRIDLLESSGISLQVVDIPELAQRNIAALLPQDAEGVVMLSLHAGGGLITVTKNAQLFFSRNIDAGLDVFRNTARPAEYFDRIVLEVQRSLDYCDSHFRDITLSSLVIAPLSAEIAGLTEHLGANLSIAVTSLDLTAVLDFDGDLPMELLSRGLMTLGAALRQEHVA